MLEGVMVFTRAGKFAKRAEASAAGRRLLRDSLVGLGVKAIAQAADLEFEQLAARLWDQAGLFLSISHCRGMVAVALAHQPVGVDVENWHQERNWLGMADQFFSKAEFSRLAQLEPSAQKRYFLQAWVIKEAYIKSMHGSVFGDLNRVCLGAGVLEINDSDTVPAGAMGAWLGETSTHSLGLFTRVAGSRQPEIVRGEDASLIDWRQLEISTGS